MASAAAAPPALADGQFADAGQRREASELGMWVFLTTEIMLFGGLFLAYAVYRFAYPHAFAWGGDRTDLALGTLNTALLLTSSFTMALAVEAGRAGLRKPLLALLGITIFLGLGFLGLKGVEYHAHWRDGLVPGAGFRGGPAGDGPRQVFFALYFLMTGLHAFHMLVGLGLLAGLGAWAWLKPAAVGREGKGGMANPLDLIGLYWHFVDLVWIFLYPLFYLVARRSV